MRERDGDRLGAQRGERGDGLVHRGLDFRLHSFDKILLGDADLEPLHPLGQRGLIVRHGPVHRGRVPGIMAGDGLEHERAVLHVFGKGTDLIERRRVRHHAKATDPSVRRLQAHNPAERGRQADRAAGVGAERSQGLVSGYRRG